MPREVGLDAVVRPDLDERAAERQAGRLQGILSEATDVGLRLTGLKGLQRQVKRAMSYVPDSLTGTSPGGGGGTTAAAATGSAMGGSMGDSSGVLSDQLEVQEEILNTLEKQAFDRAKKGGGLGPAEGVIAGLAGAKIIGSGAAASIGSKIASALPSFGGGGGGSSGGGLGGGLGAWSNRMISGIGFPAPSIIAQRGGARAKEKPEDERGPIEKFLADLVPDMGEEGGAGQAMFIQPGGAELGEQLGKDLRTALTETDLPGAKELLDVEGVPSLSSVLDASDHESLSAILDAESLSSVSSLLGIEEVPTLDSVLGFENVPSLSDILLGRGGDGDSKSKGEASRNKNGVQSGTNGTGTSKDVESEGSFQEQLSGDVSNAISNAIGDAMDNVTQDISIDLAQDNTVEANIDELVREFENGPVADLQDDVQNLRRLIERAGGL